MSYTKAQITYHWLTAALIAFMAATGVAYSQDWLDKGGITAHQIAGQILIVVLVLRIATKLRHPRTPPNDHSAPERALALAVQLGLYGILIVYVSTGYVSASAISSNSLLAPVSLAFARSDTGEMFLDTHYTLKWVLLGVFTLHLAGSLKHWLIDRDNTLSRMTFSQPKE